MLARPGRGISSAICLCGKTFDMFVFRTTIDCDRCLRWVGLSRVDFCTRGSCNASESRCVLDMYNCMLGPRPRIHILTHSCILVFLGLPGCSRRDTSPVLDFVRSVIND